MEKIEAGILPGPEIRKLLYDEEFYNLMDQKHKTAWRSFKDLCEQFLGNHRSQNYEQVVENFLKSFKEIGANMTLKMHFFEAHLDHFAKNCGAASDEDGEKFHQEISELESWYAGRVTPGLLAEYVWFSVKQVDRGCSIEWSKKFDKEYFTVD